MISCLNNVIILVVEMNLNGYFLKSISLEGKIKTSSSVCFSKQEVRLPGSEECGEKPRAMRQWEDEGLDL